MEKINQTFKQKHPFIVLFVVILCVLTIAVSLSIGYGQSIQYSKDNQAWQEYMQKHTCLENNEKTNTNTGYGYYTRFNYTAL